MIQRKKTSDTLKILIGALVLSTAVGCTEEIKEQLQPLGPPVAAEEIDKAINDATSGTHIFYAKPGQFVEYEGNYRADLGPVVKLDTILRTYQGYTETAESLIFKLMEDYYEFAQDGSVTNEKHSEVNLEMKKTFEEAEKFFAETSSAKDGDTLCVRPPAGETKYDCVKYYRLSVSDSSEPVPARAAARANCSGVPGCILPVRNIEFDRVKYLGGQFVEKEIYKFSVSKLIPALLPDAGFPPLHHFCISKLYRQESYSYYITQCNVLRDLQI